MKVLGVLILCAVAACSKKEDLSTSTIVTFEFVHLEGKDAPTYRASTSDSLRIEKELENLRAVAQGKPTNGRASRADKNAPTYRASTSDSILIEKVRAEMKRPLAERSLHINGVIAKGGEGNSPWKWHFVQDQWTLAELSAELCDGQPSLIDESLDERLNRVGSYCPWSSRVAKEL